MIKGSLPESRILSVHQRIVNRPKSVKQKCIFIPAGNRFHFVVWLVSNAMINEFDICIWAKYQLFNALFEGRILSIFPISKLLIFP